LRLETCREWLVSWGNRRLVPGECCGSVSIDTHYACSVERVTGAPKEPRPFSGTAGFHASTESPPPTAGLRP